MPILVQEDGAPIFLVPALDGDIHSHLHTFFRTQGNAGRGKLRSECREDTVIGHGTVGTAEDHLLSQCPHLSPPAPRAHSYWMPTMTQISTAVLH